MFNVFIEFPKPIIAAVNGPGIGGNLTRSNFCYKKKAIVEQWEMLRLWDNSSRPL